MSSTHNPSDQPPTADAIHNNSVSATLGELPHSYVLPDTLRNWPYERMINPHHRAAEAESMRWIESFNPCPSPTDKIFYNYDAGLASAFTMPKASFYDLRSSCDLMHAYFILEKYTDTADMENTKICCEATMDAILNPNSHRPAGEPIVAEIARQFWKRASAYALLATKERFVKAWRSYLESIIIQAARRDRSHYICTIEEYMTARRDNIGTDPCFALMEMSLETDIPHYIMEHPTIVALTRDTNDMIVLTNDMCSFKKEILADDVDYNAITVVMHNKNMDVAGSIQWISDAFDKLVEHFLMLRTEIFEKVNFPSYGAKLDAQVEAYVDGLGQWVRGQDEWTFGCGRYFDHEGLEIQRSRKVVIA